MRKKITNPVITFLKLNGFTKHKDGTLSNNKIKIVINKKNYTLRSNDGTEMYSNDLNIYWLIGVLTYYDLIDKNYKTLNK